MAQEENDAHSINSFTLQLKYIYICIKPVCNYIETLKHRNVNHFGSQLEKNRSETDPNYIVPLIFIVIVVV